MMMMMIVVIRGSYLAYRSVTNERNVPGDAVNAFVYVKITAHLGLFVLSEGGKSTFLTSVKLMLFFPAYVHC